MTHDSQAPKRGILAGVLAFLCAACLIFPTPAKALSAQSALLMEVQSGQVLFAQNEDERLPMASTTKIMTALVAVEQGDPRQLCVVSKRAAGDWRVPPSTSKRARSIPSSSFFTDCCFARETMPPPSSPRVLGEAKRTLCSS